MIINILEIKCHSSIRRLLRNLKSQTCISVFVSIFPFYVEIWNVFSLYELITRYEVDLSSEPPPSYDWVLLTISSKKREVEKFI